jgi:8-amino-7-oxononanoate synthase
MVRAVSLDEELRSELGALEASGLLRRPALVASPQGPEITVDSRRVVCVSSNDYLGLAASTALREVTAEAAWEHGAGAGASRAITGTMTAHRRAEARLAAFVGADDAVLFSSGWAANVGTLAALAGPDDLIVSDALAHASLIDGCRLSRASVRVAAHAAPDDVRRQLEAHRASARRAFVVTDTVFSMDGDRADVAALRALAVEHRAALLVDEAHALGVLGPSGRGLCAEAGVRPDVLVGTLGKAFGTAGAFVAGSQALCDLLRNRARSYVYSTAPPPALAEAARHACDLVECADDARARLLTHARRLRDALRAQGWDARGHGSPIVPVVIGDAAPTMRTAAALLEAGVLAHGIRPPTVPAGTSRLRVVPTAAHSAEQIDVVIAAFERVRRAGP